MGLFDDILKANKSAEIEQKSYKRYDYKTPPYELLKTYKAVNYSKDELQATAEVVQTVVSRFLKAQVHIINIVPGPQITRYELDVPMGVALKSIEKHCTDIAYELGVVDGVRVEAPIPGARAVAVEVPNKKRVTVGLREVISSPLFTQHKSPIPFSVGKYVGGDLVVCDLLKIPHFLIAGQAGSEKAAGLNSLIISLMYKSSPEDVRLILIDPERKEFSKFRGMPHLLFEKIVTKPIEALRALEWADKEMNRRYRVLEKYGCCKLAEYNSMPDVVNGRLTKLPHIVIIIDELAPLMQSLLSRLLEDKISSIAALARAAGIHIIAATQHPTADVITGVIKVNLTSRIAFKVKQTVDSRIIIDVAGAEALNGDGDMLYYPHDAFAPKRLQGSFVGDDEVLAVVDYVKQNYECDFDEQAEKFVSGGEGDGEGIESDPILEQVIAYVIKKQRITVTAIQRRFAIGYAKAARIVDYMEEQGFISPFNGPKPRRILITREEFKDIYGKDVDDLW